MSRRRSLQTKTPEYIQLQPYRALVGVPVKGSRSVVQAFLLGVIKGVLWALIPAAILVVAYVFRTEGWEALRADILSPAVWAAILAGVVGLLSGMVAAARR